MKERAGWGVGGLIAGALLAALLLRAVQSHREETRKAEAVAAGESPESAGSSESRDAEKKIRGELSAAQKDAEALRVEIAELRRQLETASKSGPGGGTSSAKAKSWREIAARLSKLHDLVKGKKWDDWPAEAKDLQLEMFAAVSELSKRLGMPFDEALMSPEGLPLLLIELLGQSDPPPSEEERKRLQALVAGTGPAWEAFLKSRGELSRLEMRLAMPEAMRNTLGAVLEGLRPEQREFAKGYEIFDLHDDGGPQEWIEGSRDKVTATLTSKWTESLKLDPIQERAIQPVVDEYIAKYTEMNQGFWKKRQEGEEMPRNEQYKLQVALMLETQRKLADTARLTEAQAKAMKEWGEVYGVNVYEPPPPPPGK